MFILLRGTASVSVSKNGANIQVGVLRSGDCFGEMSLLTGEPRSATVRAEAIATSWKSANR
jgi:CRP/FNR family transcriptional regulator, cyclic AMP receptor protein